jgi:hypothetical protein
MNPRITELWQQSKNPPWDGELGAANELNPEKFAEMIVQACVHKILGLRMVENDETDIEDRYWNAALEHAVLEIEQHFLVDLQDFTNDKDKKC